MKAKIEELYSIHITKEEKLSDKVTKIYDNEKKYVEQMRRFAKELNIKTIIHIFTMYDYS